MNQTASVKTTIRSTLGYTIAKRDINAGEELTDNYNTFGLADSDLEYNRVNY